MGLFWEIIANKIYLNILFSKKIPALRGELRSGDLFVTKNICHSDKF